MSNKKFTDITQVMEAMEDEWECSEDDMDEELNENESSLAVAPVDHLQKVQEEEVDERSKNDTSMHASIVLPVESVDSEEYHTDTPESPPQICPSITALASASSLSPPIPGPILPEDEMLIDPHNFFEYVLGKETFKHIAEQTNLYASQSNNVLTSEVCVFIGMLLAMGLHKVYQKSLTTGVSTHF